MLEKINKIERFESYEILKQLTLDIKDTPFIHHMDYKNFNTVNIIFSNNNEFLIQFIDNPINILMGDEYRIFLYTMSNFVENINNNEIIEFLSRPKIQNIKNIDNSDIIIQRKNYTIYKYKKHIKKLEEILDYELSPRINELTDILDKFDNIELLDIQNIRLNVNKLNTIIEKYLSEEYIV